MTILGIDPGTGRVGYGVVRKEGGRIVHVTHGCLETPPHTPQHERLLRIHAGLSALIASHRPDLLGVERLFFEKNAKTAMAVSEARGVILLTAAEHGVRLAEHTPMQIKQAVTGHGGADKRQVQEMVRTLMRLDAVPKPDDAADAVAIAYCAAVTEKLERSLDTTA